MQARLTPLSDGLEHLKQEVMQAPTVLIGLITVLVLERCNSRRAHLHTAHLLRVVHEWQHSGRGIGWRHSWLRRWTSIEGIDAGGEDLREVRTPLPAKSTTLRAEDVETVSGILMVVGYKGVCHGGGVLRLCGDGAKRRSRHGAETAVVAHLWNNVESRERARLSTTRIENVGPSKPNSSVV